MYSHSRKMERLVKDRHVVILTMIVKVVGVQLKLIPRVTMSAVISSTAKVRIIMTIYLYCKPQPIYYTASDVQPLWPLWLTWVSGTLNCLNLKKYKISNRNAYCMTIFNNFSFGLSRPSNGPF